MPLVEIKDFNALIENKPVKNKKEVYERFVEMTSYHDYTTGNLLNYSYHKN